MILARRALLGIGTVETRALLLWPRHISRQPLYTALPDFAQCMGATDQPPFCSVSGIRRSRA